MRKKFVPFFALLFFFAICGCEVESEENFQFTALEVVSVAMPEAFNQNESHNIEVTYRRPDSCTFFHRFDVTAGTINTRKMYAIGSKLTQEDCEATNDEVIASFDFIALEIGVYTFRFYTGENASGEEQYLEYVVPVKPEGIN